MLINKRWRVASSGWRVLFAPLLLRRNHQTSDDVINQVEAMCHNRFVEYLY